MFNHALAAFLKITLVTHSVLTRIRLFRLRCSENCRSVTVGSEVEWTDMPWFTPDKEKDRFYLLPGMGGRALRRKRMRILGWAVVVGVIVSLSVAAVCYWMNLNGSIGR